MVFDQWNMTELLREGVAVNEVMGSESGAFGVIKPSFTRHLYLALRRLS